MPTPPEVNEPDPEDPTPAAVVPDPTLALLLITLSERMAESALLDSAVEARRFVVEEYRRLAAMDTPAYLPDLALHLHVLAGLWCEVGRPAEAVEAAEEAVAMYGVVVELDLDPTGQRGELADALDRREAARRLLGDARQAGTSPSPSPSPSPSLSPSSSISSSGEVGPGDRPREALLAMLDAMVAVFEHMAGAGRINEAAGLGRQAVSVFRQMHEADPDAPWAEFPTVSTLAIAVHNLANMLLEVNRCDDAVELSAYAVGLFQTLATAQPAQYHVAVAMSLADLTNALVGAGRHGDALVPAEQALAAFEELHAASPELFIDDVEQARAVVVRLTALAPGAGLAAVEEAVTRGRELFAADPQSHRGAYATALLDLAEQAVSTDSPRAAQAAEEAIVLCQDLPEGPSHRRDVQLARALHLHCVGLAASGRYPEALVAATEAMNLYQRLEAAYPGGFAETISLVQHNREVLADRLGASSR